MTFSGTVAIAALSSRVLGSEHQQDFSYDQPHAFRYLLAKGHTLPPLTAAAVAAIKVTGEADALSFSLHTHTPVPGAAGAEALSRWLEALVADDPLLIGYRLPRISQLLRASGYARNLAASFAKTGRAEIMQLVGGETEPLAVSAVRYGVLGIDEQSLLHARPLTRHAAATIALVNAVTSWIIWVSRLPSGQASKTMRSNAFQQLSIALIAGSAPMPVVAAAIPIVQ